MAGVGVPAGVGDADVSLDAKAVGWPAVGTLAVGNTAVGALAVGSLAAGDTAVGALAVGPLAVGDTAVGALAVGALAVGDAAIGALAVGDTAVGALTVGALAVGDAAVGALAVGTLGVGSSADNHNASVSSDWPERSECDICALCSVGAPHMHEHDAWSVGILQIDHGSSTCGLQGDAGGCLSRSPQWRRLCSGALWCRLTIRGARDSVTSKPTHRCIAQNMLHERLHLRFV